MKKLFLIPLMALFACATAWAGNVQPGQRTRAHVYPMQSQKVVAKAMAPRKAKAETTQLVYLDYGTTHQEFASLQAAFNALPPNSTHATVTLQSNISIDYEGSCLTVQKYQNVTLDLNSDTIFGTTNSSTATNVILNKGTLTITDNSDAKEGAIFNVSSNPDTGWGTSEHPWPTYANNVIRNDGTLIINGGYFENDTDGGTEVVAAYVVDMYGASTLIINGGHLYNFFTSAIRCFGSSATDAQNVTINGGKVEGCYAIWLQVPENEASNITLTINGGEIKSTAKSYTNGTKTLRNCGSMLYDSSEGGSCENITVNINGGTFNENIDLSVDADINISGGTFNGYIYAGYNFDDVPSYAGEKVVDLQINGGTFDFNSADDANGEKSYLTYYLAPGYVFKHIGTTAEDLTYQVVPAAEKTITENKELSDVEQELGEGETLEGTIITVNGASGTTENPVTVIVSSDTEVHGIDIQNEGQIVVKDGATLTIGNDGFKSTNDNLTSIVVEAGGVLTVGNGGVTKSGNAVPVEIASDGTQSGVYMVSPNAPASVAEAAAEVTVYTRAYKQGTTEHWQHIATPVKGNITITPLGVGQQNGVATEIYSWDYTQDQWTLLQQFDKDGWSGENILTPFVAYNLINNSLPTEGGIAYKFAGDLVGNEDMTLTFNANGFSVFGNSYTAPIDLNTLFAQIQSDMSTENIDPAVYVYNSEQDRFESVNALGLLLKEVITPAFTQIPPQQAFVMNLLSGGSAQTAVDYATCVWGNTNSSLVDPIRAPKKVDNTISSVLSISVSDGASTDKVMLVEDAQYSDAYDKGADAEKYMNNGLNLYATTDAGNLGMVAADAIANTELSFQATGAVNYTMSFDKVIGDFVLVDNVANQTIAIEEGATYTFAAQPNSTNAGRFAVVAAAEVPTAIENAEVKANAKGIYTLMGQYVGENFEGLPAGVYVVNGVKIVK